MIRFQKIPIFLSDELVEARAALVKAEAKLETRGVIIAALSQKLDLVRSRLCSVLEDI